MAADFGTFGVLWILMNLFFLMVLITGGVILTKWIARRYKKNKHKSEIHQAKA